MTSLFEASAWLRRSWPSAYPFACTSLSFASCYVYSPRAPGAVAEASRLVCARVKTSDPLWLPRYAAHAYRTSLHDRQLAALFPRDATLVPVPGSPLTGAVPAAAPSAASAPWAALQLAVALNAVGFALPVWMGLRRQVPVRKSATAPGAARPGVREHYESFAVTPPMRQMHTIVLIDDVITRGRTLLAAAARLRSKLPDADIRAFALIRTLGFVQHLDRVTEVCHGVIRWGAGDAQREP